MADPAILKNCVICQGEGKGNEKKQNLIILRYNFFAQKTSLTICFEIRKIRTKEEQYRVKR